MHTRRTTHPGTAAVLSFLFNGLGQIYNGQLKKGLLLVAISSFSMLMMVISAILIGCWFMGEVLFSAQLIFSAAGFILTAAFIGLLGVYSIFDAYKIASGK